MARIKAPAVFMPWPTVNPDLPPTSLTLSVAIREVYSEDWALVEILTWPLPEGLSRDRYIVKRLPMVPFLRKVLQLWGAAEKSIYAFNPTQRLPQDVVDAMGLLQGDELELAFAKLRENGLLPRLLKLSRQTWPRDIPWDSARYCMVEWPG